MTVGCNMVLSSVCSPDSEDAVGVRFSQARYTRVYPGISTLAAYIWTQHYCRNEWKYRVVTLMRSIV